MAQITSKLIVAKKEFVKHFIEESNETISKID
jgi:hypothetical protein